MKDVRFLISDMTVVSSQETTQGTGGLVAVIGESAANSVQLVGEAAEAVMSGLSILVCILVMRQIHKVTVRVCWGLVRG